ncbi:MULTISPECIES: TRAP transporter small permease [unclassified Ruegeria]|uniref:TRAP transporter small permease n=1 Tax=unclassified Ruegeria TaxID=2625375 RepID=UPI0014890DBD|nr:MULTISPECIES: TRAP transporter small permease subunit [unclassified Ruegeria]NOD35782.1 TRAP transporter small permease subunit [Ruegeria sp. HKCCD7296]NOD47718.1 TRAP transporter small permease subunit [Ruegeria sp. HKCCD5849]NOD52619.1 TRAP transporter small permease subunit [Ruegeria sp. HKCCD5851]NOD66038.1 TRAP transporter small permease subunit [Ruegeria sp. HKCCD7303]NOE34347.1 TRAP transporter small permease subunit [Ruegeria sp. HKCCD7318]
MSFWAETGAIFSAFLSQDSFEIQSALESNATWVLGAVVAALGGVAIMLIYRAVPFVERHLERSVMVYSYLAIALIIFWGVIDRFVFNDQEPWSTTIPPLLFMVMAWFGASYNVRLRTHLSFSEFRTAMPRGGQLTCLILDAILWFGFAVIVIVTTTRLVALSASNFQIVLGTDNIMQWWFLLAAPLSFFLMVGRVFQNLADDLHNWKTGEPLIKQAVIGAD